MTQATYADLLIAARKELADAGQTDGPADARDLLQFAASLSAIDLISKERDIAPSAVEEAFRTLIERRALGEPLQHILGYADFFGLRLNSDNRALIPREDSECVVSLALECLEGRDHDGVTIADLGTGSGALLCALLDQLPTAAGIAVENSPQAASLAAENFEKLGLAHRTELFTGRWQEWERWGDCDLIISNPPYIRQNIIETLDIEVKDYDPHTALDGGLDGLDAYRSLISLADKQMKSGSCLVLEIGYDQKDAVSAMLKAARFHQFRACQDLSGHDRGLAAQKT